MSWTLTKKPAQKDQEQGGGAGLESWISCCSGGGPRQPWSSGLAPVSRFHSSVPLSHSSPSLIDLLASVDVKQQSLSLSLVSLITVHVAYASTNETKII